MKKFSLLFITLIFTTFIYASFPILDAKKIDPCDNIILKTGEEISAKIIEITPDLIKYKKCGKSDGPLISIYKNEVLMLRYSDGSKDLFNNVVSDKVTDNQTSEVPTAGIISLISSLVALLIPLPIFLATFFAGIGFICGFAALDDKHWGVGLSGLIIGAIDLVIIHSILTP